MSENRIQGDGYTYLPTPAPVNSPYENAKPIYEEALKRGKEYAVAQFQSAIDKCGILGYDVSGVQSAFNECIPFIFKGDLTRDDEPTQWQVQTAKLLNLKAFGVERPDISKFNKAQRIRWSALNSLINKATSFHIFSDEVGDEKLNLILLPAIDNFVNSLPQL